MSTLKGARRVTFPAFVTALAVLLLWGSTLLDTGKLGALVLASLLPVLFLREGAWLPALLHILATALCALLLVPHKPTVLAYALFFGPFSMLWEGLSRLPRVWMRPLLGSAAFLPVCALVLWIVKRLWWPALPWLACLGVGLAAFLLYDYAFGLCVRCYAVRFQPRFSRFLKGNASIFPGK